MLKLCTMIEYVNPACNVMLISHVINRRLPQAIHYNGKIIYVYYWLVIIPMTMKLCHTGMPTKTFNIHDYMFVNNNK